MRSNSLSDLGPIPPEHLSRFLALVPRQARLVTMLCTCSDHGIVGLQWRGSTLIICDVHTYEDVALVLAHLVPRLPLDQRASAQQELIKLMHRLPTTQQVDRFWGCHGCSRRISGMINPDDQFAGLLSMLAGLWATISYCIQRGHDYKGTIAFDHTGRRFVVFNEKAPGQGGLIFVEDHPGHQSSVSPEA